MDDIFGLEQESRGYTPKEAVAEAKRCLNCKRPLCRDGCPIEQWIPEFIKEVSKGNFGTARQIISEKSNLPAICGRVCPHELQCEGYCVLYSKGEGIRVGKLERFVADFDFEAEIISEPLVLKNRGKVAVIGSGPAGLTVAGDLAKKGFNVVVYEAQEEPGGVLLYGIPEFRLDKNVVRREIAKIAALGVSFITNTTVGENFTLDTLFKSGFDAIFIGTGTDLAKDLELPGRENIGIEQASYFLRMGLLVREGKVSKDEVIMKPGDKVVVLGAGNVAMDAARLAMRFGAAGVTVVYRGKVEGMKASRVEYEGALAEGVEFRFSAQPKEYLGKYGKLTGLLVDASEGEDVIPTDFILLAIGSRPAKRIVSATEGIKTNDRGYVVTKEAPYGMTTLDGVFAGGDVVHEPATVVRAMKEAKKVAEGIAAYIDARKLLGY
jgi:glutamate synthase (NADPH/NADH) small chain